MTPRQRRELQRALDVVAADIQKMLLSLDTENGSDALTANKASLANATRIRAQILAYMKRNGVDEIRGITESILASDAQAAIKDVKLGDFSAGITKKLDVVLSDRFKEITSAVVDAGSDIGRVVRASVTSGAPLSRVVNEIAPRLSSSLSTVETVVDTASRAVNRTVAFEESVQVAEQTDDPIVFAYTGPSSGEKLRAFCARLLTKTTNSVYTASHIDSLDNGKGQPKPVSAYCGGYNCRHEFVAMSLSRAKKQGYKIVG